MPRLLGIDYGEKRIGLAFSDEEYNLAFPGEVLENNWPQFKEKLKELILVNEISSIVLGLPLGFRNQETASTKKVRVFAKKIEEEFKLPVILENEILSTKQVLKSGSAPHDRRDASAAALILQNYLDRLKNQFTRQNSK